MSEPGVDQLTVAVILGMAVATYLTKASGLWLLSRIELSDAAEAGLEALPGTIIVAILAPTVVTGDPATWAAAGVVLLVAWQTENVLLSLIAGLGSLLLFRGLPI